MNYRALFAVIGALTVFTVSAADDLRKVANQHAKEFVQAMKTKNMAWFEKVAAPDYHEISITGKRTDRAQAVASMKQMFSSGKVTAVTSKVLKTTGNASKLSVLTSIHMAMEVNLSPKAKKPSKIVVDGQYAESWSRTGGKWLIHELKTVKESSTMDGKPMPGGM